LPFVRAAPPSLLFPRRAVTPIRSILRRVGIAVGIVLFIAAITWIGRGGYVDANGDGISVLDAIYYSTVTVTTTGYGDIYPSSPATLVTLTAHELHPAVTIVSSVKEAENAHLLRESGATTVVISSEAAGRLLGLATRRPRAVEVLEDLIVAGEGLGLVERPAAAAEVGGPVRAGPGQLPVAIVRGGVRIAFYDDRCRELQDGDVIVSLQRE